MPTDHRDPSSLPDGRSWLLPLAVAAGAVTGGVFLGAFVAVQLLATPVKQDTRSQPAAIETKAPPARAETTGSAPPGDNAAVPDCDRQTWPYLTRDCMEQTQSRKSPRGFARQCRSLDRRRDRGAACAGRSRQGGNASERAACRRCCCRHPAAGGSKPPA